MNTSYFVLISVVLTFITGFFVASIISGLSWIITPKDEKNLSGSFVQLFHKYRSNTAKSDLALTDLRSVMYPPFEESENNRELYHYHHGEN